jgi:hypothetical protein
VDLPRRHVLQAHQDRRRRGQGPGDAERLIADGRKRYPFFNGWADLSKRVADARRGAPDTAAAPPPQPQQRR